MRPRRCDRDPRSERTRAPLGQRSDAKDERRVRNGPSGRRDAAEGRLHHDQGQGHRGVGWERGHGDSECRYGPGRIALDAAVGSGRGQGGRLPGPAAAVLLASGVIHPGGRSRRARTDRSDAHQQTRQGGDRGELARSLHGPNPVHGACHRPPCCLQWWVEAIPGLAGTAHHIELIGERGRETAAPSEAVLAHQPAFRVTVGLATIELAGTKGRRYRFRHSARDPTHEPPPCACPWCRLAVPHESLPRAPRSSLSSGRIGPRRHPLRSTRHA